MTFLRPIYYNFNMTNASAVAVQEEPENYWVVNKCQREQKLTATFSIIGTNMDVSVAFIDPATAEQSVDKIGKSVAAIETSVAGGVQLTEDFQSVVGAQSMIHLIFLVS